MIKVRAAGEKKAEILIYDVIGTDWFGEGVNAKRIKAALDEIGAVEDITVRINSPGGDVFDGIAIYNLLEQHSAQIHVQVDGYAASAASLIAMAGDLITMGQGSMMMIHNPWTIAVGDANAMRKVGDTLEKIGGQLVDIYAARSGMAADKVKPLMDDETWLTAADAVASGFADEQATAPPAEDATSEENAAAEWKRVLSAFKKTPQQLMDSLAAGALPIAAHSVSSPSARTDNHQETKVMETQQTVTAADVTKAVQEAQQAEAKRRTDIKAAFGRFATAHRELLDACLDDMGCSADAAREKLLAKLGDGVVPVGGSVVVGADVRDKFRAGVSQALAVKAGLEKRETAVGNEFIGRSLCDIAEQSLVLAGYNVRGMTKDAIARKVLASLTTSDFPQLLSNTAGKVLRAAYSNFPNTYQQWCAIGQVSDFKVHPRIQLGSFNNLAEIKEGGEYTYGSTGENYENAQALTKGKGLKLTRQMIVNDDLGGFNRRAQIMGRAAARSVNSDAYAFLTSGASNLGPTSTDTGQYFNATATSTAGGHANYTSSGTAISTASIAVGRSTMRKQKDATLSETLNILPKTLVCSVLKEDLAWAVLNSVTEISQSNPNKKNYAYDVAKLDLVTDPYLDGIGSGLPWYMFADPMDAAAAFEVVFLDGQQTPFIDDEVSFETDSLLFKVRLDYGVAIGDWRGGYRNAGA